MKMKKMLPLLLTAFALVFCCACNAVTPGPSTTRSMAAQVSVETTADSKESSTRAQKPKVSDEETTEETTEETNEEETAEEETAEEETSEKETSKEETRGTTREETSERETTKSSTRKAEEDRTDGDTLYVVSAVNVRDAASKNSNVVGTLSAGEAVTSLGDEGGWTKILYDGEECYVSTSYLSEERQ